MKFVVFSYILLSSLNTLAGGSLSGEASEEPKKEEVTIETKTLSLSSKEFAEIIPGKLYLSSVTSAENKELLDQLKITHIVNLTGYKHNSTSELRYPPKFPESFKYQHLIIKDEMGVDIITVAQQAHIFIVDAIHDNGRVLVHCEAGISRSSTVVISYLMSMRAYSVKTAYNFVKERKANIGPNKDFYIQLLKYEADLRELRGEPTVIPSLSLEDYLVEQMLEGVAAGFERTQVIKALQENNYNLELATEQLFQNL